MSRRKIHWRDRMLNAGQVIENHAESNFQMRVKRLPSDIPTAVTRLAPEGMKQESISRVVKQMSSMK